MTDIQDIIDLTAFDLFIFDLDGTLTEYKTGSLLPGVTDYFETHPDGIRLAIASNQGGVGLRQWMEKHDFGKPQQYPTAHDVELQLDNFQKAVQHSFDIYVCYAYRSKKGEWSPVPADDVLNPRWSRHWRKPQAGMLVAAMTHAQVSPDRTLMIGDWDENRGAAQNAGCFFVYAHQFFNRPEPEPEGVA